MSGPLSYAVSRREDGSVLQSESKGFRLREPMVSLSTLPQITVLTTKELQLLGFLETLVSKKRKRVSWLSSSGAPPLPYCFMH